MNIDVTITGKPGTDNLSDALEQLLDAGFTVEDVCESLADVCHAKSSHIEENWQDYGLARAWDWLATRMENAAQRARNVSL